MAKRCVFGCLPNKTLFSVPRPRWLRARWLEFLHFKEEGLTVNSRLCSRHFTSESFQNLTQYEMGFAKVLYLKNTAVPSVYTVGAPQSMKPLTRDVGCQCSDQTSKKSASVQASCATPRPKRRSKAVQVKPLVTASSENHSGTSTPVTRPRMEESAADLNHSSMVTIKEETDFTYEPEMTEDDKNIPSTNPVEQPAVHPESPAEPLRSSAAASSRMNMYTDTGVLQSLNDHQKSDEACYTKNNNYISVHTSTQTLCQMWKTHSDECE